MPAVPNRQLVWVVWLLALMGLLILASQSAATSMTRSAGAALLAGIMGTVGFIVWRHRRVRIAYLAFLALAASAVMLPIPRHTSPTQLGSDYAARLRSLEGVPYFWGGESRSGIDCSGLTRRALIDACCAEGLCSADPALLRHSIWLWWNDTSARTLGQDSSGLTTCVMDAPGGLNALNHRTLLPGDLAVTRSGVHVLAYLGDSTWVQADPNAGRVTVMRVPAENGWFGVPVRVMRWSILRDGS